MATKADMLAKIAGIPLDPSDVSLIETLQNDRAYWLLSGWYYELLADGQQKRRMYKVEISEPQT